jgi:hypothetical protein
MDSNFQVKITADLGDLAAKIKNIEATLAKLDSSFKTVGAAATETFKKTGRSVEKTGAEVNRARLATFAFGQVIRDAGFFSQSFGLGLLAISNNVPILIDQLVMLSGVSDALGSTISLLGSLLTAALTIWAYSSMAVGKNSDELTKNKEVLDRVKLSGDEYYKTLGALDQARIMGNSSAQSELTTLKLLYSQYQNSELSLQKRKEAYDQMQELYPSYFGNIKFEQKASDNTKDAYDRLTNSILATARARAAGDLITKNSQKQLENEQKIIDLGIEANKAYSEAQKAESKAKAATAGAGEANERTALSLITKANSERTKASGIQKEINSLVAEQIKLRENNLTLERSVTEEIKKGGRITDEEPEIKDKEEALKKIRDVYKELSIEIKKVSYDTFSNDLERATKLVDVHKKSLQSLIELGVDPLSKGYNDVKDSMLDANKKLFGEEGKIFAAKLQGLKISNESKLAVEAETDAKEKQVAAQKELNALGTDTTASQLADDPTYAMLEKRNAAYDKQNEKINSTKELLMNLGNVVVGPLAGAFETMFRTGEFGFKSIISALGQVIAKLLAAIAAAAILAVVISLATGGAAGGGKSFGKAFAGLMGGKGMFSGLVPNAKGGVYSGPTAALVGEYPGAKNNPEVIAPLDKLKSLIGNSGSGEISGQLEARISGNDLVILMNRASKNRNGYY